MFVDFVIVPKSLKYPQFMTATAILGTCKKREHYTSIYTYNCVSILEA